MLSTWIEANDLNLLFNVEMNVIGTLKRWFNYNSRKINIEDLEKRFRSGEIDADDLCSIFIERFEQTDRLFQWYYRWVLSDQKWFYSRMKKNSNPTIE